MRIEKNKILITGAEGFIGSHLCEALVKRGVSVRALVLYNSFNKEGWLDEIPKKIYVIILKLFLEILEIKSY